MVILVTLLVALVGLLMFALCTNPKLIEIGKISYFCGLLATLLRFTSGTVSILK